MAYVVTDNCYDCLFTDCVAVCPVDCFYADDRMIYIHPDECIDCDACVPACPVQAIYNATECPDAQKHWIDTAAEKTRAGGLEHVTQKRDPLPTAEAKKEKLGL